MSVAEDMVMRLDVAQVYAGSSPVGHQKQANILSKCDEKQGINKTIKKCVVPGTKIPYVNWIQAWLVSLREKRKKKPQK